MYLENIFKKGIFLVHAFVFSDGDQILALFMQSMYFSAEPTSSSLKTNECYRTSSYRLQGSKIMLKSSRKNKQPPVK